MELNENKYKTLIHYIISKCQNKENFGKTVLYKILYFSDFNYYELNEKLITGEKYKRFKHGPVPNNFNKYKDLLIKEGIIQEKEKKIYSYTQYIYKSLKKPDMSIFSNDELNCIDQTIVKLSNMTANEINDYSHGDMPWKIAEPHEELDPEYVFYRDPQYCVNSYY